MYIIFHILSYFLWVFLIYLAYLKSTNPIRFQERTLFEMKLKEILSSYLTFYFYFLYDPFNKINLGIMITGPKCLLSNFNDPNGITGIYQFIFGIIGILSNILMTCLIMYFFRNFEFHDTNGFKRKHSIIIYIILLLRFTSSIIFALNS